LPTRLLGVVWHGVLAVVALVDLTASYAGERRPLRGVSCDAFGGRSHRASAVAWWRVSMVAMVSAVIGR